MMRVAQIIDSLKMGGAEQLVTLLVQESRKRNLETTVISLRMDMDRSILAKIQDHGAGVCAMPASSTLAPGRIARLTAFLRDNRFQIVQTHLTTANIVGTVAAHFAGVKTVGTLHSVHTDPRYYNVMREKLETRALRHAATRVIAVGEAVAEAHRSRLMRSIDIIPNAVPPLQGVSYMDRCEIRRSLPGDPQTTVLISVGRLSPPKGFEVLIKAFSLVRKAGTSAKLMIVGAGILEQSLKDQIRELELTDAVFLLGRREDVPGLLAASDLYVSASHWEGLPVSILEAMSAGLPVVATAVGDIPRVVVDGTGYIVAPGNPELLAAAIRRTLADPENARCMGRLAREQVLRNHSPSAWMDQLLNLYGEVLHPRPVKKAI